MATELFSRVPRERLKAVLENLHAFTELPIHLIDQEGNSLMTFGESPRYCRLLQRNLFPGKGCLAVCLQVGQRAKKLGEPYIFSCHADLNHIAFPLLHQDDLLGCIIVGPFLMDKPDSTLIANLTEKHKLTPTLSLELYDELPGLQVIPPARVNQLSVLLDHLLSPLMPAERVILLQAKEKLYQQSRINETIQQYKEEGVSESRAFFHEKENALLSRVRAGNVQQAKALLNELIGHVLFSQGGRMENVQLMAVELTTLLSRVAMDGGAATDKIYGLNSQYLTRILMQQDQEELCYMLQEVVENFMDAMFIHRDQGNPYIRKALRYIAENFTQKLTLQHVAGEVGISPNHFSTLFHKTVGINFREYLSQIRVEESKRLLLYSDASLADIAASMGFPDQSNFSKVFKRITGMSPGKYRG